MFIKAEPLQVSKSCSQTQHAVLQSKYTASPREQGAKTRGGRGGGVHVNPQKTTEEAAGAP